MKAVNSLTETQIEEMILRYLNALADSYVWKNPTTGYFNPRLKRFVRQKSKFAINGKSDLMGFYKKKSIFVEVKNEAEYKYLIKHHEELKNYYGESEKKTHLRDQIQFIERAQKHGQIAFFACSIECVKKKLMEYENAETKTAT